MDSAFIPIKNVVSHITSANLKIGIIADILCGNKGDVIHDNC